MLFDIIVTGGLGTGKTILSKSIAKFFGREVAKEATASVTEGMVLYGGRAGEAVLADLAGATARNQLQQGFSTSLGRRIIDVLVDGVAYESKVGYVKYSQAAVNQIMKDAELIAKEQVDGAVWHFFRSGVTREIGADQRLLDLLTRNGIKYVIHK